MNNKTKLYLVFASLLYVIDSVIITAYQYSEALILSNSEFKASACQEVFFAFQCTDCTIMMMNINVIYFDDITELIPIEEREDINIWDLLMKMKNTSRNEKI